MEMSVSLVSGDGVYQSQWYSTLCIPGQRVTPAKEAVILFHGKPSHTPVPWPKKTLFSPALSNPLSKPRLSRLACKDWTVALSPSSPTCLANCMLQTSHGANYTMAGLEHSTHAPWHSTTSSDLTQPTTWSLQPGALGLFSVPKAIPERRAETPNSVGKR